MSTVKCALGKRGRPSHEWNDGKKDRIYCLGRVDPMTDDPLCGLYQESYQVLQEALCKLPKVRVQN